MNAVVSDLCGTCFHSSVHHASGFCVYTFRNEKPCGCTTLTDDTPRREREQAALEGLRTALGNARAALDADRRRMVQFIWAICHQHGGTFALTDAVQREVPSDAEVAQFYDAEKRATVWTAKRAVTAETERLLAATPSNTQPIPSSPQETSPR